MKKILLAATTLLLSVPVLVACGNTGPYVEPGATTITMYAQDFEDWSNAHLDAMVDDFNAIKDDGIQLEVKSFQDEAYTDALKAARENGSAPDIFMTSYGNIYSTAVKPGYAAPLNDLLDQAYYDDIVDSVKNMITFDGTYYSYPQLTEPATVFFYRKDILAEAGVTEVPTTWDELLAACALIKPVLGRGQYTLGMPIGTALGWATYGMQYNTTGGLALNDQWTESLVDSQGYRDLNGFFYDLYANGYLPAGNVSPTGYNDIIDALCEDKLAMTFAGSWSVAEIMNAYPDYQDKIGVAAIPTKDGDPS
ncbi:MAG TPA: extracellular solute-binding protein, partial [Sedimentisphaerales bacterium]